MIRIRLFLLLTVFLIIFIISHAQDSEIILARADAQRTGVYPVSGLPEFHEVVWEANISLASLGSPVLYDGVLYMGNQRGFLHAIDAETGEILWRQRLGGEIGSVAIVDNIIYAGGARYFALDRETGESLWSTPLDDEVYGSPLILENQLFFTTSAGTIYAIDLRSHEIIWQFEGEGFSIASLASWENLILAGIQENLFALDNETGDIVWQKHVDNAFWFSPAIADGKLFVGAGSTNFAYAIDVETGEELWQFEAESDAWSAAAIGDGLVYIGNKDGSMYALDAETGEVVWQFAAEDWLVSDPVLADGILYFGEGNHMNEEGPRNLYALDATTGEELWRFQAESRLLTAPALGDNALYAVTIAGNVYALK
jgi:eukaryotic-like serine/threonine-protein kinase